MNNIFKGVVYLTEEQYRELKTNGTITVGNLSLPYDEDTLYVTPDNITDLVHYHTELININAENIKQLDDRIETVYNNIDTDTLQHNDDLLTAVGVKNTNTNEFKTAESLIKATNIIIYEDDE